MAKKQQKLSMKRPSTITAEGVANTVAVWSEAEEPKEKPTSPKGFLPQKEKTEAKTSPRGAKSKSTKGAQEPNSEKEELLRFYAYSTKSFKNALKILALEEDTSVQELVIRSLKKMFPQLPDAGI